MILYIDTSSSYLYSAIVDNKKLVSEVKYDLGHDLSRMALPYIVEMFEANNIKPEEIEKIIVVNGPGSFTGIRVGLTIAKVYAFSLKIPITTVTSLEVMHLSSDNKVVVPIIDALKGNVYAAIYVDDKTVLKPQYISLEKLKDKLSIYSNYEVVTNDEIEIDNVVEYVPDFVNIIDKYKNKKNLNPHSVNPDYLKLSSAEEAKL